MIIHNIPINRHAHVIYRRYIIADIGVVLNFIEVNSIIVFSCICNKNETTTCKISRKSQSYTVKEVVFFCSHDCSFLFSLRFKLPKQSYDKIGVPYITIIFN